MKSLLSLMVALAGLGLVWADDKKDADDKKIQGKWEMVKGEQNGEPFPDDFVKGFKLNFDGEKYDAKLADGSGEEGKVKLKADDKPASATFTAGSGDVRQAIYKWDGEKLVLCVSDRGGDKPKEFAGKDGNMLW